MQTAARIISTLLHPMLMPVIGVFILFNSGTHLSFMPSEARKIIYTIILTATCGLPLTLLPLLRQIKIIHSFQMETSRERIFPTILTALFYCMAWLLLKKTGIPIIVQKFLFASLLTVVLASVISIFWKISIHMIGIGGVTGSILVLAQHNNSWQINLWITLLLAFAAFTASARLHLGAHNPSQVYTGYLCGLLTVAVIMSIQ